MSLLLCACLLQDELQAELEWLERSLDESVFEKDRMEEQLSCPKVSSTASPSQPGKNHLVQSKQLG